MEPSTVLVESLLIVVYLEIREVVIVYSIDIILSCILFGNNLMSFSGFLDRTYNAHLTMLS